MIHVAWNGSHAVVGALSYVVPPLCIYLANDTSPDVGSIRKVHLCVPLPCIGRTSSIGGLNPLGIVQIVYRVMLPAMAAAGLTTPERLTT